MTVEPSPVSERKIRRSIMLLATDVGNTNITFGVYEGESLKNNYRITTKIPRTSDEFGIAILDLLNLSGIGPSDISGAIIASVVPNLMHSLINSMVKYLKREPLIVGPGIKTGIKVTGDNPRAIGADRIVDAVAAYEKYGAPVLVLDYGTATTYDLVREGGVFCEGVTAPGLRLSADALSEGAAKLPKIQIADPGTILAKETVTSMQAGVFYGQIGATEYIINRYKKETGYSDLRVVATGGLGRMVSENTELIDLFDPFLTLDGLRIIYDKNV